jgi:DNA repair protein RadD
MLKLRYYQEDAVESFFDYTANNWGQNPLIIIPTAGGKALVQATIIKRMLEWSNTRILLLTHDQNLIQQNFDELMGLMNDQLVDSGIYCASLKRRDTRNRVLFAGIQSVYKKAWELGFFNLILIDEAHLTNHKDEGMYRSFLKEMKKINKNIVIGGLTATGFRLKGGFLHKGKTKLFDDVCHETTIAELMNPNHPKNRDKKQYLCPLISPKKAMKSKVDLSEVHTRMGEYVSEEMQTAFCKDNLVERSVKEIIEYTVDRNNILVFTAGIKHCDAVVEAFEKFDQTVGFVHSKRSDIENQKALSDFKKGNIKYLVNVDKLTTGYNQKNIDCIAVLRSTQSPGLWIQILGRGCRLHPDKENCLVLDFGGNIDRIGPIDKIEIKEAKDGSLEVGTMPQKTCPKCESVLFLAVMVCPDCGYEFPQRDKHDDEASEADIISKWKRPEAYDVEYIHYSIHQKIGSPDMLRVQYYISDLYSYSEYICPMHTGFAKKKALRWLELRLPVEDLDKPLCSIQDIIDHKDKIKQPKQIIVDLNGKYPNIIGHIFEEKKEHVAV